MAQSGYSTTTDCQSEYRSSSTRFKRIRNSLMKMKLLVEGQQLAEAIAAKLQKRQWWCRCCKPFIGRKHNGGVDVGCLIPTSVQDQDSWSSINSSPKLFF